MKIEPAPIPDWKQKPSVPWGEYEQVLRDFVQSSEPSARVDMERGKDWNPTRGEIQNHVLRFRKALKKADISNVAVHQRKWDIYLSRTDMQVTT